LLNILDLTLKHGSVLRKNRQLYSSMIFIATASAVRTFLIPETQD